MAIKDQDDPLAVILDAVSQQEGPTTAAAILQKLPAPIPLRTLQYRLRKLVAAHRLIMEGEGRWAKYRLPAAPSTATSVSESPGGGLVLSQAALRVRHHVRQATAARRPVGYDRSFLDAYHPNETFYLSQAERAHLLSLGRLQIVEQPAGTYARHILNRLLIDLAWNSSRLEGNTYSLLDTRRLIEFGEALAGRAHQDAQMILNHKDAIEFLVSASDDIGFNRYTVLNLHGLLANNLLADAAAVGRLRYISVGIERSVFHPLAVPQLIEEAFDQLLATADAITDPFEQAFFVMAQLPYLQPFDDVNKRVSRLAANIPFIKHNLSPLSFVDVPQQTYIEAMLGVYELNSVALLKDVFLWAYQRSAAQYAAVRQSLGEPDPFRLRYRTELRELVGELVRAAVGRQNVAQRIAAWAEERVEAADRIRFVQVVEAELMGLHEGNFARYQIRPSQFDVWWKAWQRG